MIILYKKFNVTSYCNVYKIKRTKLQLNITLQRFVCNNEMILERVMFLNDVRMYMRRDDSTSIM